MPARRPTLLASLWWSRTASSSTSGTTTGGALWFRGMWASSRCGTSRVASRLRPPTPRPRPPSAPG
eukprot:9071907-Alexandrium_andersonii.AAC.1